MTVTVLISGMIPHTLWSQAESRIEEIV